MNPITVQTAEGAYVIPTDGAWGSWSWVRTATLIATAYRQVGDAENAKKWSKEYSRRLTAYQLIEKGKDIASIVAAVGQDILSYPKQIADGVQAVGFGIWATAVIALVVVLKGGRK